MMADDDRERAVKEVAQVYERIKAQHPLLLLHCSSSTTTTQLLAQSLLSDALRALNVALSVMKQQQQQPVTTAPKIVNAETRLSPPSSASADSQAIIATITARRAKKRRSSSAMEEGKTSSWIDFTTVPYEDGYEWRKYGEKKINGTTYTRSYFRCTYKEDTGCQATKHVQQKDSNSSDPPMFQVTYNNHHTCKNCTITTADNNNNDSSEGVTRMIRSRNNGYAAMNNIKQEQPTVLPPPLLEISAALPFDGTPPLMTSPSISDESWDEYSAADMAQIAEASAGHDLLYDPELVVLCTSFNVY